MKLFFFTLLITLNTSTNGAISYKDLFNSIPLKKTNLENSTYTPPLYETLEWRIRLQDEGDVSNTLRIRPLGFKEGVRIEELTKNRNALGEILSYEDHAHQCLSKNLIILQLFKLKQTYNIYKELQKVYGDFVGIIENGIKKGVNRFNENLKTRERLLEVTLKLKEISRIGSATLSNLKVEKNKNYPKNLRYINFKGFIEIPKIKKYISTLPIRNSTIDKLKTIASIKKLDYESEVNKEKRIFRHIQLSHRSAFLDSEQRNDNRTSLELSFNLPWGGVKNSQGKMIEWQKGHLKMKQAIQQEAADLALNQERILIKINNYQDLKKSDFLKDLNKYLLTLKKSRSHSPYKIVQIKESILKQKLNLLNLRLEITKEYFYSLAKKGNYSTCSLSYLNNN